MRYFLIITLGFLMIACGDPAVAPTPTEDSVSSVGVGATSTPEPFPTIELPAPLYGLAYDAQGVQQIWRLDRDARTLTQLTQSDADVMHYAISPLDGTLAYVSNNALIRMRPDGRDQNVLFTGPPLDKANPDVLYDEVGWLHWSPDGQLIAFQHGGVVLIPATGGDIRRIAAHEINASSDTTSPTKIERMRTIIAWAPDSQRLAILESSYDGQEIPHNRNIMIVDTTGAPVLRIDTVGTVRWTADGSALLRMAEYGKLLPSGIWRIDATTGAEQPLIDDPKLSVRDAYVMPDGSMHGFVFKGELLERPNGIVSSRMTSIDAAGALVQLNQTPYAIQGGLWFPDGSAFLNPDYANTRSRVQILYADGRPSAELVFPSAIGVFRMLAWGR